MFTSRLVNFALAFAGTLLYSSWSGRGVHAYPVESFAVFMAFLATEWLSDIHREIRRLRG